MQRTLVFALAAWSVSCGTALAQSLEPRAYVATPIGMNILGVTYSESSGSVVFDPSLPVADVSAKTHAATLLVGHRIQHAVARVERRVVRAEGVALSTMQAARLPLCRQCGLGVFAPRPVVLDQAIGHVVLVDVGDVRHGFPSDALGRDLFDVTKPDVRIQSFFLGL